MALKSKPFGELITFARATGGGRFNAQGAYEWLSADQPRFDFDPVTLDSRGILIEEQRTNLLLRSSDIPSSPWATGHSYVRSSNAEIGLDGQMTADFYGPVVGQQSFTGAAPSQSVALTAGTYTVSAFFKPTGIATTVRLYPFVNNTNNVVGGVASLTLGNTGFSVDQVDSDGVFSGTPVGRNEIFQDGWRRVSLTFTVNQSCSMTFRAFPYVSTSQLTGDGTSGLFIWGAQLEAGAFPTSYIPTTTAQVTRAADVCSVNNLSPWYRADEGTLMVEASTNKPVGTINTVLAASLVDPSAPSSNHVVTGRFTGSALIARLAGPGGSPYAALNILSPYTAGTTYKTALAWRSGDIAAGVNGEAVVKSLATFPNIPVGALQVGAITSTVGLLNGHIRRVRYIPRRISDTELQALTAI